MTSSARISIVDPALLIIVPNKQHFSCVSNELLEVPYVEQWDHHEVLLPPGHFQKDSLVLGRLPDGLYLSPFFPESIQIQIRIGSSMKLFFEIRTFSFQL